MPSERPSIKTALIALLNEHLEKGTPQPISWNCNFCSGGHSGNLLKKIKAVADAGATGILLLADEGKVLAVIDISKNKKFNSAVADTFQQDGAIYIQLAPVTDPQANIKEILSRPSYVNTCLNPKCSKCGGFQQHRELLIIEASCWKCNTPMKVALVDCNYSRSGPETFTQQELAISREHGVDIRNNFSQTVSYSYLSNTCPNCEAMTGEFYLFTGYYVPAMNGDYPYETFSTGYFCPPCTDS